MEHQLNKNLLDVIKNSFLEGVAIKNLILSDEKKLDKLLKMSKVIAEAIYQGGKLLLCGNGGSAADAQHLATELLVRLRTKVDRFSLPAINLAIDSSFLTATSNDYSFDEVFCRSLSGLGRSGDVLLGITTSGNSKNVLKALNFAQTLGIKTLGLLGATGGVAVKFCDYAFMGPSHITARIQEVHIAAGHIIMELVEELLIARKFITLESANTFGTEKI